MATTPNSVYYPVLSDAPNGPSQMQQLAQSVDHKIIGNFATAAARAAAITAPGDGDMTYRADAKVYEKYSSAVTAWTLMPGQVVGTVNTATAYTSTGTNGVTETACAALTLALTNIEAGRNYLIKFGGRFTVSVAETLSVLGIHALQGTVVVGSPVIASFQKRTATTDGNQSESMWEQLWVPGASGSWNILAGIKSGAGTGASTVGAGTQNAFLTVVAA